MNEKIIKSSRADRLKKTVLGLRHNVTQSEQNKAINNEIYSSNAKVIIAHEDIWVRLITEKNITSISAKYLMESSVILMTEGTRLNIMKEFSSLIDYYERNGYHNIREDLKRLVVPVQTTPRLSWMRKSIYNSIKGIIRRNHPNENISETARQIFRDNRNLIEGIAAANTFHNKEARFLTEDLKMLYFCTTRQRTVPKILELIKSEIIEIDPVIEDSRETISKPLYLTKSFEHRKPSRSFIRDNQLDLEKMVENNHYLAERAVIIDNEDGEILEEDDDILLRKSTDDPIGIELERRDNKVSIEQEISEEEQREAIQRRLRDERNYGR